jgi:hypothetical protein
LGVEELALPKIFLAKKKKKEGERKYQLTQGTSQQGNEA